MTKVAPDVRGAIFDDEQSLHLMDHPDSTEEVPTLDISSYLAGEAGAEAAVAARLREITMTVGFFYLTGHDIPESLIGDIFAQSRRFHSQPEEKKRDIPFFKTGSFKSGYQAIAEDGYETGNLNIVAGAKPNLQSRFVANREDGSGSQEMNSDGTKPVINVWPSDLPGFKEVVQDYHRRIENLGRQFLPLWATSLNLERGYFESMFKTPHVTLALLHYPPQKQIGDRQYGIAPHTDNAFMTILAPNNVSGLAVQMPSGHWRHADHIKGAFLVNTGNLMVRLTNGQYLSTKHRVINNNLVDRYAIPVFFGPSEQARIDVVPTCRSEDDPPKWPSMTYRELRQWYYG